MKIEIRKFLWAPTSLRERAINASLWNIAATVARYPLRLAGNLVMVRILAPEAFGMMATVASLQIGLALFSDVGIVQSVMRSPRGDTPRFLRTAWAVQIIRGALITGIMAVIGIAIHLLGPRLAGPGTVYADPRLPALVAVSSLALFVAGFQSTAILLARRRMEVGGIIAIEIVSMIVGMGVMIGLGLVLQNVWALVIGPIAGSLTGMALSHRILSGPRMRFVWDKVQVAEMWSFGKWLIWASVGGFLINNGDRLIFAALIDKSLFGVYAIAVVWVEVGTQILQKIAATIFIPTFRSVHATRPGQIGRVLMQSSRTFSLVSVLVSVAAAVTGILCIKFLYAPVYQPARSFILILSFRSLVQMFLVFRQYTIFQGDTRYSAVVSMATGVLSLTAASVLLTLAGFEWALFVIALGWAPVYAAMLLHPDVRRHVDPRPQLLMMAAIVAGCALTVAWIGGW